MYALLNILKAPFKGKGWLGVGLALVLALGCAGQTVSSAPAQSSPKSDVPNRLTENPASQAGANPASDPKAETSDGLERKLRTLVGQWEGAPHRMGGNHRDGIDCSGFVQRLYLEIFDRKIPRSTQLQVQKGLAIHQNQLQPGDLVFFKPPYKKQHVGIYLGQMEFAHASTSKGVTISNLGDTYWTQCYWTARRYIETH